MTDATPPEAGPKFSARELDVLILSSKGFTCNEVGAFLQIAGTTVADHRKHIFRKLDVMSMVEAAVWACKAGLV